MKKFLLTICISLTAVIITSCGHNLGLVGIGTGWRVGNGEYGLAYGDGIFGTFVTRDGVTFKAELDSTMGFSYDPSTNTYKGIKSFEYSLPPQIAGYAVDFAKNNPEVAKLYYEALVKYYEVKRDTPQTPLIDDAKSQQATTSISSVIKAAIAALYKKTAGDEPFDCPDGNCEFKNCREHADIAWQAAAANKLMTYSPRTDNADPDTGKESDYDNLVSFIARMAKLSAEGKTNTKVRIDAFTIKDSKLTAISFGYTRDDGTWEEVVCVSCLAFDD